MRNPDVDLTQTMRGAFDASTKTTYELYMEESGQLWVVSSVDRSREFSWKKLTLLEWDDIVQESTENWK